MEFAFSLILLNASGQCFAHLMLDFRDGRSPILVATDVASRGLGK